MIKDQLPLECSQCKRWTFPNWFLTAIKTLPKKASPSHPLEAQLDATISFRRYIGTRTRGDHILYKGSPLLISACNASTLYLLKELLICRLCLYLRARYGNWSDFIAIRCVTKHASRRDCHFQHLTPGFNLHQLCQCDINANACMIKSYWKPHTHTVCVLITTINP